MKRNKIAMFLLTIIVLGTVVYAFMDGGSPKAAREKRFDDTRTDNIRTIKSSVYSYYSKFRMLPKNLNQARENDTFSKNQEKYIDPESNKEFEYQIVNDTEYKICATFSTNTIVSRTELNMDYAHPAGRYCFTFYGDRY